MNGLLQLEPGLMPSGFWRDQHKAHLKKLPELPAFSLASIEYSGLTATELMMDVAVAFESDKFGDLKAVAHLMDPPGLIEVFDHENVLNQSIRALWLNFDIADDSCSGCRTIWPYVIFHQAALGHQYYFSLIAGLIESTAINQDYSVEQLRKCIDALPPQASVLGVSLPVARNHGACRLVIYNLDFQSLTDFLDKVRWQGDSDQIHNSRHLLQGHALGLLLDIFEDRLSTRIGIEILLEGRVPSIASQGLLDYLQAGGLIHASHAEAITQWQHTSPEIIRVIPASDNNKFISWINHVKLTFDQDKAVAAKIYFGLQPGSHEVG